MHALHRVSIAAVLGLASLSCGDGSAATPESASRSTQEAARERAAADDLAPVVPSAGRGDAFEPSDGVAQGAERKANVELDHDRPIMGRVVVDGELPEAEHAWVIVMVPDEVADPDDEDLNRTMFRLEPGQGREAARAPLRADLTFAVPRPVGDGPIRLRAEGVFLFGGGVHLETPPDRPVEVPATVGAAARLRFALGGIGSEEEVAALEGRRLLVIRIPDGQFSGPLPMRSFEVDESGRGLARGLLAGTWEFTVQGFEDDRDSLAPFLVEPGFQFTVRTAEVLEVDVPVRRARRLAARVVDGRGVPVEGAQVRVSRPWSSGFLRREWLLRRTSDADGRVAFGGLSGPPERVVVEADGFPTRRFGADEAESFLDSDEVTIVMDAGAALRLTVTTSGGLPAKGVQVTVTPDRARDDPLVVWTDEDGEATFHPLPAGGARVSAAALEGPGPRDASPPVEGVARFHPPSTAAIDASAGPLWCLDEQLSAADIEAGEVTLPLVRAPEVTGHVHGIAQDWPDPVLVLVRPESSRVMSWLDGADPMANVGLRVDRATSSFSGQVAPGTYEAVATAGRGEGASIRLTDARLEASGVVAFTAVDAPVELELGFESPAPIAGRIQEPDGTPVPGTEVTLRPLDIRRDRHAATSDDLGSFTHAPLRPGRYTAYVADQRFVMADRVEFTVPPDRPTPEVVVVLSRAGAARITVIGPDGVPRERPLVDIQRVGGGRAPVGVADEDSPWPGAHAPLEPGLYVAAAHSGRSAQTGEFDFVPGSRGAPAPRSPDLIHTAEFEVVAGEVTEVVVREREEPVAEITGHVEVGGAPSPGKTVWLARDDAMLARAVTDDAGRFSIPTGFTGAASLWVHGVREQAAARLELDVTEGPNPVGAIDLPTGRVIGRMPADLRPAAGAIALPAAFAPGSETPLRYSGGVDDGRFTIEHLPDGDHVIGLPIEGGGVDCAVTVRIENGATVRGVVLGSSER